MSPSYGEDMFRIDVFVHINDPGDHGAPDGLFRQFRDLFRDNDIPFRIHWGKFLPEYDHREWAEYYRAQHSKLDDSFSLRMRIDPDNIFLTDYWRRHFLGEGAAGT